MQEAWVEHHTHQSWSLPGRPGAEVVEYQEADYLEGRLAPGERYWMAFVGQDKGKVRHPSRDAAMRAAEAVLKQRRRAHHGVPRG